MKKVILIFFLLSGCAYNETKHSNNYSDIIFSDNLTLDEFEFKLMEYTTNSPYPNIDN
jgi:hypothetical protein